MMGHVGACKSLEEHPFPVLHILHQEITPPPTTKDLFEHLFFQLNIQLKDKLAAVEEVELRVRARLLGNASGSL